MFGRVIAGGFVGALAASVVLVAPVQAVEVGDQGCTPGFWKVPQHHDSWQEADPDTLLSFDPPGAPIPAFANSTSDLDGDGAADSFLDALNFRGGSGLVGAERILMRAAVAAWLNAATEELGYPIRRNAFVPAVNDAIASGDRETMLALAAELDDLNNSQEGCPLS
jgi:hypothetical protein